MSAEALVGKKLGIDFRPVRETNFVAKWVEYIYELNSLVRSFIFFLHLQMLLIWAMNIHDMNTNINAKTMLLILTITIESFIHNLNSS